MSEDVGRISGVAYRSATGTLAGIALAAYAFRLYVQFRILHQFGVDDGILVLSVTCMIACTVLDLVVLKDIYAGLDISLHGIQGSSLTAIIQKALIVVKADTALLCLYWSAVSGVKLAYLLFFRKLVFRVQHLTKWWWTVLSFVIAVFVANVIMSCLTCPYSKIDELLATEERIPRITIAASSLDVVSDILIISIPIGLLRHVRIDMRQKVGVGLTLCLSTVMAIIALIRVGGMRLPSGAIDYIWAEFWMQQECSIAVTMVSVTASRAFFVMRQREDQELNC